MIRLKDDWVIDADGANYILGRIATVERVNKKTGERYTAQEVRNQTFHRTIGQASTAFLRRIQRELVSSNDYTIQDAVKALQGVADEVNAMLSEQIL